MKASFVILALVVGVIVVEAQKAPAGWTCPKSSGATYGERRNREDPGRPVVCDCGCGVWDTDCDTPTKSPQDLDYAFYVDITCPTDNGGRETRDGANWACSYVDQKCVEIPEAWICEPNWYNQSGRDAGNTGHDTTISTSNGVKPACHCGCGAPDPDCGLDVNLNPLFDTVFCTARAWAYLDSINIVGSNSTEYYCHAPTDTCKQAPEGWTCPAHWYNEQESLAIAPNKKPTCNCGCGLWDPDCALDAYRFSDDAYGLRCGPEQEVVTDTHAYCTQELVCAYAPEEWTCPGRYYDEENSGNVGPNGIADCNCGCGVFDPDCVFEARRNYEGTSAMGLYDGTGDSDDVAPSTDISSFCSGATATIVQAPTDWICAARDYGEADSLNLGPNGKVDCDCNCGIYDPDCDLEYQRRQGDSSLLGLFCEPSLSETLDFTQTCARKTLQCATAPQGFVEFCPAKWYNQVEWDNSDSRGKPYCDCDCGHVMDPDCHKLAMRYEDVNTLGLSCESSGTESFNPLLYCSLEVSPNASQCVSAPSNWECPPNWYNEYESGSRGNNGKPDCDCACGAYDVDCYHEEDRVLLGDTAFGMFCEPFGKESFDLHETCEKRVNQCNVVPSGWVCPANWYNEFLSGSYEGAPVCNCGCGIYDADCAFEETELTCSIDSSIIENGREIFDCTYDKPVCL